VLRLERDAAFGLWAEPLRKIDIDGWITEVLDPVLAKLDTALPHCFGWDFARKGDLTVLMPAAILSNLIKRVPFVLEMRNVPFAQQRQVLWHVIERLPRKRAGKMDAGGNGMQIAEETVERWGSWIEAVMLTEPWYRENMPLMKADFEDGTIELPRDREVTDDFRAVKLVRGVPRVPDRTKAQDGKKRHGDAAIAAVLMTAASRADPEIYELELVQRSEAERPGEHRWRDRPDTWAEDNPPPARTIMPERRGGMFTGARS
jgi:phage FluMu gp28-like protein